MSVQQKIFGACAMFVVIIAILGGLARHQAAEMGRLAINIYDHNFLGMSYVDQAQAEFLRLNATRLSGEAFTPRELEGVLQRLDVALDRAASPRTRSAGLEAHRLLTELPNLPTADVTGPVAEADRVIAKLVTRFSADGLEARDEAEVLAEESGRLVLEELTVAVGLALAIGWLVGRNLSQPLRQLVGAIDRLTAGQLEQEIDPALVIRQDEIGAVARATAVFHAAMRRNARMDAERALERERNDSEKRHAAALELDRLTSTTRASQRRCWRFATGLNTSATRRESGIWPTMMRSLICQTDPCCSTD